MNHPLFPGGLADLTLWGGFSDRKGVEVPDAALHRRLLPEGESELVADVLGGEVLRGDDGQQLTRIRSGSLGQQSLAGLGGIPEASALRHQPVSPFQPGPALEADVVNAGVSDNTPTGQLGHRLLAKRDDLADGDHVVEPAPGLLLGADAWEEHHEILVAEELDPATQATTGVRYYPMPGGGIAYRTGAGTSYGFEITDQHGTPVLTLDNTAQIPTWRQFTPYGESRGTAVTWPGNRGFLDKPTDTNTGLTIIGARQYDPTAGRFISLDPLLDATSPQELGGYTYAAGNPVTNADPTGLCMESWCPPPPHGSNGRPKYGPGTGNGDSSSYTPTYTPDYPSPYSPAYHGPGSGFRSSLFQAPVTHSSPIARMATPQITSTGTYNAYTCGRFGTGCAGTPPRIQGGGSNPFSWVWRTAVHVAKYLAHPDYGQFCMGGYLGVGGALCVTRSRDGRIYGGFQLGIGIGGFGASVNEGYIGGHPTNRAIDNFVNGPSTGVTAGLVAGASFVNGNPPRLSWDNNDGFDLGVDPPGLSFWTSHMWNIP